MKQNEKRADFYFFSSSLGAEKWWKRGTSGVFIAVEARKGEEIVLFVKIREV